MTGVSFGDLAQSYALRTRIGTLKGDTFRLAEELASGRKADVAGSLSGDTAALAALERSRTLVAGFASLAQDAAARASARQGALATLTAASDDLTGALTTVGQDGDSAQLARVADQARQAFIAAFATLNTRVAGRALFAGQAVNGSALGNPQEVLNELARVIGGARTAAEIDSAVTDWFDGPSGFESLAYDGAAASPEIRIDADGTTVSDITANDAQIRAALKGIAMAAFIDHPGLSAAGSDRVDLRDRAIAGLRSGSDALIDLSGRLGFEQGRIEAVLSRQQAEDLGLELAISGMVSSDPARTATELEAVRSNLETVYAVTARLSRLTLAEFLR